MQPLPRLRDGYNFSINMQPLLRLRDGYNFSINMQPLLRLTPIFFPPPLLSYLLSIILCKVSCRFMFFLYFLPFEYLPIIFLLSSYYLRV